jgi:rod shape determining protein RodA
MLQQLLHRAWVRLDRAGRRTAVADHPRSDGDWLATVYSASYSADNRLLAQALNMAVGLAVMWCVAQLPPQKLMRFGVPLYVVRRHPADPGVSLRDPGQRRDALAVTRLHSHPALRIAEDRRAADARLVFPQARSRAEGASLPRRLPAAAGAFALIAKQPDLGTAILVGAAGFYVIFFAGLPWKVIVGLGWWLVAPLPFRLDDAARLPAQTHSDHDRPDQRSARRGLSHHPGEHCHRLRRQPSARAGWSGTQTHLEFIPERHTDFIFAVYAEERGLLGNTVLLLLYLLLITRGLMIAANASTLFARVMAGSITLSLFTYVFVNVGMVSGILPVVGVPLPFMSYGGTARGDAVDRGRHPDEHPDAPHAGRQ